ncbi:undecaprenyl-diphosphate phosphatase [Macrococcus brunensis]|uniref:Undecaprenyl-diphosphatase n=1 Tax=Macrococcus brunensis TaxID=198483 RepID=A0A4R6BGF0_9STAP|nr:undecaprenyl-diphosphate phosphatase [Macrococcus brunensis]TDL98987.1 undecaprenyl-diphosphate phosphatase [Macrococcus brunensis]ULG72482.1 undecaprenyl-diphosphate phosphatase [Macrococcus brunensis]
MEFFILLKAIILGIVEGLTEFAPVSSTGHQILVDDMWLNSAQVLGSKESANTFKIVIQLGSILAAAWIFRHRFVDMLSFKAERSERRLKLSHIIIGLLPAGIAGLLFDDFIDEHLFSVPTVLVGLALGAILMIVADIYAKKVQHPQTVDSITYRQAFIIGLVQILALWPGFSRSGSTISAGVLTKLDHKAASDFTFMMAVPIMAAASAKSLISNYQYIHADQTWFYILGFIFAFIFGILSIKLFLDLINRVKLIPFAIYRLVLVAIIAVLYFGFGIGKGI